MLYICWYEKSVVEEVKEKPAEATGPVKVGGLTRWPERGGYAEHPIPKQEEFASFEEAVAYFKSWEKERENWNRSIQVLLVPADFKFPPWW